jgi:hypothetical protein
VLIDGYGSRQLTFFISGLFSFTIHIPVSCQYCPTYRWFLEQKRNAANGPVNSPCFAYKSSVQCWPIIFHIAPILLMLRRVVPLHLFFQNVPIIYPVASGQSGNGKIFNARWRLTQRQSPRPIHITLDPPLFSLDTTGTFKGLNWHFFFGFRLPENFISRQAVSPTLEGPLSRLIFYNASHIFG